MKRIIVACLLATVAVARAQLCNPDCSNQPAQCCNQPQADTFSALEPDTHEMPGSLFRGVLPDTAGAQCAVGSSITSLAAAIPQPGAAFETLRAPGLGGLLLVIRLKSEFATLTGNLQGAAGNPPAACFKLDVEGLVHPPSPITFTTGCGTQTMSIGQPKYACVLGAPISRTLVCFAAKRVGALAPLPSGFDRLEDVCVLADVI